MADNAELKIVITESGQQSPGEPSGGVPTAGDPVARMSATDASGMVDQSEWDELAKKSQERQFEQIASLGAPPIPGTDEEQAKTTGGKLIAERQTELQQRMIELQEREIQLREKEGEDRDLLKKAGAFVNPLRLGAGLLGSPLNQALAGDGAGAIASAGDWAAGGLKAYGGAPGAAVGGMLNVLTASLSAISGSIDTMVRRGQQLAPYSGELTAANVKADIIKLHADIEEAREAGPELAELTVAKAEASARFRKNVTTPLEKSWASFTTWAMDTSSDISDLFAGEGGISDVSNFFWGNALSPKKRQPHQDLRDPGNMRDFVLNPDNYPTITNFDQSHPIGRLWAMISKPIQMMNQRIQSLVEAQLKLMGVQVDAMTKQEIRDLLRDNKELGGLLVQDRRGGNFAVPQQVQRQINGPAFGGF